MFRSNYVPNSFRGTCIHHIYFRQLGPYPRINDIYLHTKFKKIGTSASVELTNPPFAFQTAFPRGTDFSVSTGRVKKLHTLLVSLYF